MKKVSEQVLKFGRDGKFDQGKDSHEISIGPPVDY